MGNWTLFSNHGHVLVCLARDSEARLRDVAIDVGITERAVQKIVRDLQHDGMVSVTKNGRRNRYRIHKKKSLRHDLEAHCTLNDLIAIVNKKPGPGRFAVPEMKAYEKSLHHLPEPPQNTVEPQSAPVVKPRLIEPKPVRSEPEQPGPGKAGSGKSEVRDITERQQGSLF